MRVSFSVLSLSFAAQALAAAFDDPSCPPECNGNASDSKRYDSSNDFASCNKTVFFSYENFYDPNSQAVIACTKKDDLPSVKTTNLKAGPVLFTAPSRCMTATNYPKNLNHGWWGDNKPEFRDGAVAVGNMLRNYMSDFNHCQEMSTFASQGNTFGAVWAGSQVQNNGVAATLITYMVDNVSGGMPNAKYLQWCDDKDPAKTAGIIIDASGNKEAVRQAMQQWSMGKCWSTKTGDATWNNKDLWFFSYEDRKNGYVTPDPGMGVCNYKTVVAGDIMTTKCGVTRDSLMIFNPGLNVDNPPIGMPVCCSAGALPNLKPPADPNPDGSCRVHTVVTGQSCEAILATYYPMTKADLMGYNKDTYGWMGCGGAYPWDKTKICISNGTPPRPVATWNAECGSLAPGDKYKSECPLKACCSKGGFCGLSGEHCAKEQSPTGAPGTTGCETNCDISYVKGSLPSSFIKVGYYESWSVGWKCMNGGFSAVDWSKYTHVHFSFADIGLDLQVKMDLNATSEFASFKSLYNVKKIVSFGGWGISTDVGTYQHLRNAMLPGNVDTVVTNLVNWMNASQLDGLDIDWEYPGAPDIKGIPPGLASDAPNYLNFLKKLKAKMPVGKSLSIAAPASYWYLKQFPITDMAQQLDYIVYMTYDLHGQWDYNIDSLGPNLRSHVNWTETQQALNLITHAGVPSNKVLLGLGAYGRSFQQVDPNCSGPSCKFTGPPSGALPGKCTNANGYISLAGINKMIKDGGTRRQYYDQASDSDVLLYGKDQWVAWSSENSMRIRGDWAKDNNLGGTVLWAADLVEESSREEEGEEDEEEYPFDPIANCPKDVEAFSDIDAVMAMDGNSLGYLKCLGIELQSPMCFDYAAARSLFKMSENSISKYKFLKDNNYETIFKDYYQPRIYDTALSTYKSIFSISSRIFSSYNIDSSAISLSISLNDASNGPIALSVGDPLVTEGDTLPRIFEGYPWTKYFGYKNYREEVYSAVNSRFFVRGVYMKDEKKFLSDMTSMLKVNMTMSLFKWGKFDAPLPWGCRQQGGFCQSPPSQIVFDSFPIIDMDMFIPDPMGSVESNMTSIIDFTKKLDVATTKWVEDPMDIVAGSRLPLMSLVSGIDSMFLAYDTGLKYKRTDEIEKENALVSLILGIVFLLMSFVPGLGIVAAIGEFAASIAMGNLGNPIDIITAVAGVAGDVFKVFKGAGSFVDAARVTGRLSDVADLSKLVGKNKKMAGRIEKIEKKFTC
ncbi:hypothetical protein GGH92_000257 [Coemansia sp. RSA 2673]|nr:hypothetical protein GGH92_000257 [Coemansia sp. RSA 2673]